MARLKVFLFVTIVYVFFLNTLFIYNSYHSLHQHKSTTGRNIQDPVLLDPATTTPAPCISRTHALLIIAPIEIHPRSNDPSDVIRVLAPIKSVVKRLASGVAFLAVTNEGFTPSHRAWCDRLQSETAFRVACHLLLADNSTSAAALDSLRHQHPCLSSVVVVEDPEAVDPALIRRLASASANHYACIASQKYKSNCPVYVMPLVQ